MEEKVNEMMNSGDIDLILLGIKISIEQEKVIRGKRSLYEIRNYPYEEQPTLYECKEWQFMVYPHVMFIYEKGWFDFLKGTPKIIEL